MRIIRLKRKTVNSQNLQDARTQSSLSAIQNALAISEDSIKTELIEAIDQKTIDILFRNIVNNLSKFSPKLSNIINGLKEINPDLEEDEISNILISSFYNVLNNNLNTLQPKIAQAISDAINSLDLSDMKITIENNLTSVLSRYQKTAIG